MNSNELFITRRRALHLGFAMAGTVLAQSIPSLLANDSVRPPTPENVLGPFYPVIRSMEKDADLTTIRGHKRPAEGKIIHLTGRVLDLKGEPVKGARVEIWQANTHGRYAHPLDSNPAPLDPNFQGYAVQTTDKEGRYRKSTVVGKPQLPRTRHYSMSASMNGVADGSSWTPAFQKASDIKVPLPTKAFVFIDEHPAFDGDCIFYVIPPVTWMWWSFPDARHQNGANLSFADGHVEHWKWYEPNTIKISKLKGSFISGQPTAPKDRDLSRLQECIKR